MTALDRLECAFFLLEEEVAAEWLRETGTIADHDTVRNQIATMPELRFRERLAAALKEIGP